MVNFYADTLRKLLERKIITKSMKILVVCAGEFDRDVLSNLGFSNVVISNLDVRMNGDEFAPFSWSFQDAENLTYGDNAFDFCIAHSGLHHCFSPHRALLEMYRVAQKGLLVLEPRDSFLVRLGVRLNFGQEYEVAAVAGNHLKFGGVKNTAIPNYVYRWTEREVEKTVRAYVPWGSPNLSFFYALRVPEARLKALKNPIVVLAVRMAVPFLNVFTFVLPKQSNNFAFAVQKPTQNDLQPWLSIELGTPVINEAWIKSRYNLSRFT
jgi:SAM-dependent methyltransferase